MVDERILPTVAALETDGAFGRMSYVVIRLGPPREIRLRHGAVLVAQMPNGAVVLRGEIVR